MTLSPIDPSEFSFYGLDILMDSLIVFVPKTYMKERGLILSCSGNEIHVLEKKTYKPILRIPSPYDTVYSTEHLREHHFQLIEEILNGLEKIRPTIDSYIA